ncbi:MAG: prepilin-type N-terminal cleavage/methylation domain-containing protein [Phycisphaerae bacterium]|nr:prepilin-type N-terminal cleavage/methylation domain-containing protein [Phycisphaerae bacterium]
MVVVIMIVAILAAMVAPRYSGSISQYHVTAAARKVAADLAYTQARARAVSTTRTISFGVTGSSAGTTANTYQILSEIDPTFPNSVYTVDLSTSPYLASITLANFSGAATVSFNGFGIPSGSGSIVLQSGTATSTLTLDGTSGTVSIQ